MFTNNWFEITGIKNFEKYVLPLMPKKSLEIGCYEGRASVWLLEHTLTALTVIDTFEGSDEHDKEFEKTLLDRFKENVKPYEEMVDILKGTSRDKLRLFIPEETYDFIYIDGAHYAMNALEDAVLAFPSLKQGGIMIFDDYTWGVGMPYHDIPAPGIDAFLNVYGNQIDVLEKNSQVIIRKKTLPPVA